MAKVKIEKGEKFDLSPSEQVIKKSSKINTKYDESGRKLGIKIPSFQESMKYDLYFGKFDETNKKFYESNKFILFIKEIDDEPVSFPHNEAEALALASRLGDEGVAAIIDYISELTEKKLSLEDPEVKNSLKK